jgi:hypothetical protein
MNSRRAGCAGKRRRRRVWALARQGALAAFAILAAASVRAPGAAAAPSSSQVTVSIGPALVRVPPSFLGLSVEDNELPLYEHWFRTFERLLSVLRPRGDDSPVTLRIGGESADSSVWGSDQDTLVAPAYRQRRAYQLTDQWMAHLGSLVQAAGLKVILDLNLAAHSPRMAADEVASARRNLPAHSVSAFEVGNEPDLFKRGFVGLTRARRDGPNAWAFRFTIPDYISLLGAYVRAIDGVFRDAPIAGPSTTSEDPRWVKELMASRRANELSLVTTHEYPLLDGCAFPGDGRYPALTKYLKDAWIKTPVRQARRLVAAAASRGLPLRITEAGSSYCGGLAGQTNTFATALWAPDLLFSLAATGVTGVNIHVRANGYANSALQQTTSGIYPEPLFYGMMLFTRALGPDATLMQVARSGRPERLKVWAVRLKDGSLRVVYINKSSYPTSASLHWQSRRSGSVQRLSAPSIRANTTVKLAGQRFGPHGHWQGKRGSRTVRERHGAYKVFVPAFSAALLLIPPG